MFPHKILPAIVFLSVWFHILLFFSTCWFYFIPLYLFLSIEYFIINRINAWTKMNSEKSIFLFIFILGIWKKITLSFISMMFYYDVVIKSKKCSCYFDKKSYINLLFFCSCVYSDVLFIYHCRMFMQYIVDVTWNNKILRWISKPKYA